ncbi:TIGR04086 family membrane protein [Halalkalibacter sp. APA_J-10(15)]|uniref:TIGR04086 family membrane protein n=1 Tax=Halalkalibacter sp. APA_J-10(15) TaxID=2933805 RepID=UPI0021ADE623|nr:TIGR04086 family membrane protein [Halalkalibacter sp. APA_J-10(15)]MCK0471125.1 TIGR04086 family membrane protein [Halalkalibacter sp. APA_J-10(15)]
MNNRGFFPAILFGFMTILVLILTTSLVISLILSFSSLTEQSVHWFIITIAFLAMFTGGLIAGGRAKEKGLLVGAITALMFSLLTFLIQFLGFDVSFSNEQYLFHGLYILTGAIGGIVGVNLSSE